MPTDTNTAANPTAPTWGAISAALTLTGNPTTLDGLRVAAGLDSKPSSRKAAVGLDAVALWLASLADQTGAEQEAPAEEQEEQTAPVFGSWSSLDLGTWTPTEKRRVVGACDLPVDLASAIRGFYPTVNRRDRVPATVWGDMKAAGTLAANRCPAWTALLALEPVIDAGDKSRNKPSAVVSSRVNTASRLAAEAGGIGRDGARALLALVAAALIDAGATAAETGAIVDALISAGRSGQKRARGRALRSVEGNTVRSVLAVGRAEDANATADEIEQAQKRGRLGGRIQRHGYKLRKGTAESAAKHESARKASNRAMDAEYKARAADKTVAAAAAALRTL